MQNRLGFPLPSPFDKRVLCNYRKTITQLLGQTQTFLVILLKLIQSLSKYLSFRGVSVLKVRRSCNRRIFGKTPSFWVAENEVFSLFE